jgi:hypothetical protein
MAPRAQVERVFDFLHLAAGRRLTATITDLTDGLLPAASMIAAAFEQFHAAAENTVGRIVDIPAPHTLRKVQGKRTKHAVGSGFGSNPNPDLCTRAQPVPGSEIDARFAVIANRGTAIVIPPLPDKFNGDMALISGKKPS